MNWQPQAGRLADQVTHQPSAWYEPVASTPRHLLVPAWWANDGNGWNLRDGQTDAAWAEAAYRNRTLVTRIGRHHADLALSDDHPKGRPTSSSTLPSLVIGMFE